MGAWNGINTASQKKPTKKIRHIFMQNNLLPFAHEITIIMYRCFLWQMNLKTQRKSCVFTKYTMDSSENLKIGWIPQMRYIYQTIAKKISWILLMKV